MSLRPRTLTLTAAGVGLALTALVTISAVVPLTFKSLAAHVALDTAQAMIALLAAYLVFGRFRASMDQTDLFLVYALLMLATSDLVFSVLPLVGSGSPTLLGWTTAAGRIAAAAALALSALLPKERVARPRIAGRLVLAATGVSIAAIGALGLVFEEMLPEIVRSASTTGGLLFVVTDPAVLGVQALVMVLYVAAALGFTKKAGESDDDLMRWLGAAAALGAVARINYLFVPSLYTAYVYTGDILRFGFYLAVLWGSSREIRKYWTRLETTVTELRELDATKNTLLAGVSHDLKSPIAIVMGASMTLEQAGDRIEAKDRTLLLHRITVRAQSLDRIVGDLLDFEKAGAGVLRPDRSEVDLHVLVREALGAVDGIDPESAVLEGEHLIAHLDRGRVERILDNLIRNAMKHTEEGSQIWIRWWSEDDGVIIAVEDNGPGVPETLRDLIFTPFARGKDVAVPGSGVGLAVVATFAKLHGGRAWVEDRAGGGASFRVFLPCGER